MATNRELMTFIVLSLLADCLQSPYSAADFTSFRFRYTKYGSGMMQLTISSFMSLFSVSAHEIRGHSGITGSFAFYCPERIAVTGTFNQTKSIVPTLPFSKTVRPVSRDRI